MRNLSKARAGMRFLRATPTKRPNRLHGTIFIHQAGLAPFDNATLSTAGCSKRWPLRYELNKHAKITHRSIQYTRTFTVGTNNRAKAENIIIILWYRRLFKQSSRRLIFANSRFNSNTVRVLSIVIKGRLYISRGHRMPLKRIDSSFDTVEKLR